jgi:hypothetical protein
MVTTQGCRCGAVRHHIGAAPLHRTDGHCVNCHRVSGAQAVAWTTVPMAALALVRGEPVCYRTDTHASRILGRACRAPLTYQSVSRPEHVDTTTGSLDDSEDFPPTQAFRADERLSWGPLIGATGSGP